MGALYYFMLLFFLFGYCAIFRFIPHYYQAIEYIYKHGFRLVYFSAYDLATEHIDDVFLDEPFQRACTILRVKAALGKIIEGIVGKLEVDALGEQLFLQQFQLDADDTFYFLAHQRAEHDHIVYPVQEFGPQRLAEYIHYLLLGSFHQQLYILAVFEVGEVFLYYVAAHIAGHDDDGIFEIHHTAFVVC